MKLSQTDGASISWFTQKSAPKYIPNRNVYINVLAAGAAKSRQSCLTLCDPVDGSPLGSPIPGILQARTLEWVAISFSKRTP